MEKVIISLKSAQDKGDRKLTEYSARMFNQDKSG